MIFRNTWSESIFTPETVLRAGMSPNLEFKVCGVELEPQHPWNAERGHYDMDQVSGYGLWVCQDVKTADGMSYRQNPVMVVVLGMQPKSFKFGDSVVFKGLGGFYSRKKHVFRFQADQVTKKD